MIENISLIPPTINEHQNDIRSIDQISFAFSQKSSPIIQVMDNIKNIDVVSNSLSNNFISVPRFCNIFIILELGRVGINDKHANNNAVAIEENDKTPFIISV